MIGFCDCCQNCDDLKVGLIFEMRSVGRFRFGRSETLRRPASRESQAQKKNEKRDSLINGEKFAQNYKPILNPKNWEKKEGDSSQTTIEIDGGKQVGR
jgi:hypothetical protein